MQVFREVRISFNSINPILIPARARFFGNSQRPLIHELLTTLYRKNMFRLASISLYKSTQSKIYKVDILHIHFRSSLELWEITKLPYIFDLVWNLFRPSKSRGINLPYMFDRVWNFGSDAWKKYIAYFHINLWNLNKT